MEDLATPPLFRPPEQPMTRCSDGLRYLIPAAIVVAIIAASFFLFYIALFGVLPD